jgi:hypothetical protein
MPGPGTGGPVAVVIGDDAGDVGAIVVDLEARGLRAAAFIGDPATERDALVEMLAELFPARPGAGAPESA